MDLVKDNAVSVYIRTSLDLGRHLQVHLNNLFDLRGFINERKVLFSQTLVINPMNFAFALCKGLGKAIVILSRGQDLACVRPWSMQC